MSHVQILMNVKVVRATAVSMQNVRTQMEVSFASVSLVLVEMVPVVLVSLLCLLLRKVL